MVGNRKFLEAPGGSNGASSLDGPGVAWRRMAAILDLPEVRARVGRWSVADYERLAELGVIPRRVELIRGIIVEKMPKSPLHTFLIGRICEDLRRRVHRELTVRQEPPLRLADSMPEPDAAVVRGTQEDFRARHPTTAVLVVEVAVSSAALDRENASLYAEAGVSEYWIVLGTEERVEVYRQPIGGIYQNLRTYARGEAIDCASVEGGPLPVETWFA
jgi:Uma2 family endonuclease